MNQFIDQFDLYRLRTKRDAEAFGRVYDRYIESIFRFVALKLPNKAAAEDVTSETFLKLWQVILQNQEPIRNVRAFLYRLARNGIADFYRKQASEGSVTFSDSETSTIDEDPVFSDRSAQHRAIEARADLRLVLDQIERLKESYRDVLMLRLIDGLSFGDIGKVLDKSVGNVRVIYHRAIKALDGIIPPEHE
jgi:RNA polymerase sigma-70 factor (ECF subfamily)